MKTLTWQAVGLVAVGVTGFVVLYLFVAPDDPIRGALVTAFNGIIGALIAIMIGWRQVETDRKVDKVIEQTNGHAVSDGDTPPGKE